MFVYVSLFSPHHGWWWVCYGVQSSSGIKVILIVEKLCMLLFITFSCLFDVSSFHFFIFWEYTVAKLAEIKATTNL